MNPTLKPSLKSEIQYFIRELKGQMKENKSEMKSLATKSYFSEAAHLESVNCTTEYVIDELEAILKYNKTP